MAKTDEPGDRPATETRDAYRARSGSLAHRGDVVIGWSMACVLRSSPFACPFRVVSIHAVRGCTVNAEIFDVLL